MPQRRWKYAGPQQRPARRRGTSGGRSARSANRGTPRQGASVFRRSERSGGVALSSLPERAIEIPRKEWFRKMLLESGRATAGAIFRAAVAAHGDGHRWAIGAQLFQQRPAVAIRQTEIGQEHVPRRLGQCPQRLRERLRRRDHVPGLLQMPPDVSEGIRVIFNDKDAHAKRFLLRR